MCGVVEGFYGRPWTLSQRKDLFEKMEVKTKCCACAEHMLNVTVEVRSVLRMRNRHCHSFEKTKYCARAAHMLKDLYEEMVVSTNLCALAIDTVTLQGISLRKWRSGQSIAHAQCTCAQGS
jgi:hypothetical protein